MLRLRMAIHRVNWKASEEFEVFQWKVDGYSISKIQRWNKRM